MKKALVSTTLLGVLMGAGLFIQTSVYAETANNTTANITINGGGLNIDNLASIDFGSITLNGKKQTISPKTPAAPILSIHDYRGKTDGWSLQAGYEKDKALGGGMTLKLNPSSDQGGTVSQVSLSTTMAPIYKLTKADLDKQDTNLTLNPTIDVPANTPATNYTGTIVWNAVEGAPA
ncbi:WxL domain-containing protein [Enterococcus sp. DIV0086]|uniref:WxL domain-containing protein n=1 Tax=Enterococcus sp. DIV0086 TaxID=2774655 RepID=UPI003D2906C4